jgi:hypothetical protein
VGGAEICGELLLKDSDLAAEEEDAAVKNVLNRPVNFSLELVILRAQIHERNDRSHQ